MRLLRDTQQMYVDKEIEVLNMLELSHSKSDAWITT